MSYYRPIKLAFKDFKPCKKTNGDDIILIHGVISSKETWYENGQKLADELGSRVFALDMRNHGDSGWSDLFDYEVMAKDVIAFMDEYCTTTPILIGHSMGGKVAMTIVFSQPDKVRALIVEDISPKPTTEKTKNAIAVKIRFMQNLLQLIPQDMELSEAVKFVGKEMLKKMPEKFRSAPELGDRLISTLQLVKKEGGFFWKMNSDVLEKCAVNWKENDLQGHCQKPALFLYGTLSPFKVFQDKELILKLFPKAQLCGFENSSHDIHMECPENFFYTILPFLKGITH